VDKASDGRFRLRSLSDGPVDEWIREQTKGYGVAVNIGAVAGEVPIDVHRMMDQQLRLIGSAWFTPGEGQDMTDLAETGALDLSPLEHRVFPLERVNEAVSGIAKRNGGFTNFVISPTATA
jgi:alcohol dehydrogenase